MARGWMVAAAAGVMLACASRANATLVTLGFEGIGTVCEFGCTFGTNVPISGRLTFDTAAATNPDGSLSGAELTFTAGQQTYSSTYRIAVTVFDNQLGGFCDLGQHRDFVGISGVEFGWAFFDDCSTGALAGNTLSDLAEADFSLFGSYDTGPGQGLGIQGSLAPPGQLWGNTTRIFRVPEPSTLLLIGTGLLGFVATRRRRGASRTNR